MIPETECGLSLSVQNKLSELFAKKPFIEQVVLYGSRAKGNFKSGSDIDLTIKSSSMQINDLLKIENEIDDLLLPYKVDLSIYSLIDNENLKDHIARLGKVFFVR